MIESSEEEAIFPEDWYKRSGNPDMGMTVGIRCFDRPDYSKRPKDSLSDHFLFERLLLSLRDFAHAGSAATFILQDVNYAKTYDLAELRRFQAYETSLIVSYSRPFSETSAGLPRLSYKSLGIKLSSYTRAIHDDLIDKRNTVFAHSDVSAIEYSKPVITEFERPDGSRFTTLFPPKFREGLMFSESQIRRIENLISCNSDATFHLLHAMHPNFEDRYQVLKSGSLG